MSDSAAVVIRQERDVVHEGRNSTFKASRLYARQLESFLVSIVFLRNCSRQYASTGNRGLEKTEVKADRLRHGKAERKVEHRRGKQAARLEPAREDGSF